MNDLFNLMDDTIKYDDIEPFKVEYGDIYEVNGHRIMCGDSTSIADVSKLMNGKKADLIFTDPPYGISYSNNMNDKFEVIKNDDKILDIMPVLLKFSKSNIHWYIWTSHQVYPIWREMFNDYYKHTIIWYKRGGGIGDLKGNYASDYEMCIFCQYGRREFSAGREGAVWDVGKDNATDYVHPTQKPVSLSVKAFKNSTNKGDIVLDLFGGSGSTLIGAELTNRKAFIMELDVKYVEVILNRFYKKFGKEAVKLL